MRLRRIIMFALVLAVAAAAVWGYSLVRSAGQTPKFRTARVERGPLTATVSASGSLNAVVTVQVGSQVSGQIKELFATFNSAVTKGQLIARIDPDSFEARVRQAQAEVDNARAMVLNEEAGLEKARADADNMRASVATARANTAKAQVTVIDTKRDLERKRGLLRQELIAQSEKDAAETAHDSAVAQLEANRAQETAAESTVRAAVAAARVADAEVAAARANLKQKMATLAQAQVDLARTFIRAPVDGVVVSRNVDVGQTVAASLQAPVLFTIAQDLSRMQVDTSVDEADVGRVQVGQRATFTVDAFPRQTFAGEVNQIRKAAQIVQNVVTYTVVVGVENSSQQLLPGMTANVRIVTDSKPSVLKVPNAALRFRPPGVEAGPDGRVSSSQADRPSSARGGDGRAAIGGDERRPASPGAIGASANGVTGRAWVFGPGGNPVPRTLELGLTDGAFTEVLGGNLSEGTEVLVGLRGGAPVPAPRNVTPRLRL
jgi:HlyD family secretion protein